VRDYQCLSKSQRVRTVLSNDVDDSKVIKNVHVPFKTANIIEDIAVGSDTSIIDESTCFLIVPVMMWMR